MDLFKYIQSEKYFLILIFILSIILNFLFFTNFLKDNKDYFRGDTPWYQDTAIQIANGNGVTDISAKPTYYRVPGYSYFLALSYKLFNFDQEKTLDLQIFLSGFIPLLIFILSLIMFSNLFIAKLSSFLFVFNLGTWLYSGFLMSEVIFELLFLMFLIFYFSFINRIKFRVDIWDNIKNNILSFHAISGLDLEYNSDFFKAIWAGAFLGLASLVRPVGQFVVILSIIILFFSNIPRKQIVKFCLYFFLSWLLIVSPWLIRNYFLTDEIFFHSMTGNHFLTYLASDVKSIAENESFLISRNKLLKQWSNESERLKCLNNLKFNPWRECNIGEQISYSIFKKYPIITLKRCFINILKTVGGFHVSVLLDRYSKNFIGYDTNVAILDKLKLYLFPQVENKILIFFVYYEIVWMLFLLGSIGFFIISIFYKNLFFIAFVNFSMISLFIFLTLGIGLARLRYPTEPLLTILSIYFWTNINKK